MIVIEKSSIINGNWNAHAQRCNVVIHSVDQRTATIKFRSAFGFDQCSHVLVESIIETSEVTEMRVSCYYQKSEFRKVEFLRIELKVDFGLEGGPISNLLGTSGFHSE